VFGRVSFVGIEVADSADPAAVKRRIEERYENVRVFDRGEWVKNNVSEVAAGFLPLLVLVSIVGAVSASLLVAMLVQGAVDDRRRDIAILLALGTPASAVGRSVVLHAEAMVLGGGLLGAALMVALKAILKENTPMVELAPRVTDLVWVVMSFGLASLAATMVQLLRLRRIDPAEAFRP
jgi:ABC-type antimicrobial peptide transport system permease subunit